MTEERSPKSRGLGRGLNALFEDEEGFSSSEGGPEAAPSKKARFMVGLDQLYAGKLQPRHVFDEEALTQLADSIKNHGLLQPILVRQNFNEEDRYEIIAGERRWRAAQRAQLHEVPVVVLDLSDVEALEIALIENLQREDLNAIDEAKGYKKLLEDYGHTQEKLAEAMGKSRPHIANTIRLLSLPEAVQSYVSEGRLSPGHARALITAKDPGSLAVQIMSKGLSVRQTEKLAADHAGRPKKEQSPSSAKKKGAGKDPDTLALEAEVSNALGMRVSIESRNGHEGHLSIEFKSLDQLDEILHRLSHFPGSRLTG